MCRFLGFKNPLIEALFLSFAAGKLPLIIREHRSRGPLEVSNPLLAFNFAVTPHFASWQTLNVNLTQVATIVIVSVGMTLVIATGGIDLSVGSLMAISGAIAPMIFLSSFGRSYPALGDALAFIVPVGVAGLFGLVNGWFITRFQVQPIVGTLVMFIADGALGKS
jgi:galactofuranose transport system permease protein